MAVAVFVPSRIGEGFFTDLPAPTAGDDAKAITYDHGTGAFVYAAAGGGGTPGGSNTQVQYNNAGAFAGDAGMTYDAATDRLTVAGGLVAGDISPPSDTTTAFSVWNAARSTRVATVDTVNEIFNVSKRVTILSGAAGSGIYMARSSGTIGKILTFDGSVNTQLHTIGGGVFEFYQNSILAASLSATVLSVNNLVPIGGKLQFTTFPATTLNATGAANRYGIVARYTVDDDMLLHSRTGFTFAVNGGAAGTTLFDAMRLNYQGRLAVGVSSPTALLDLGASIATCASLRVRSGVAPTTTNADGDMWNDGSTIAMRVNGTNAVNTDGGLSVWMQSSLQARNVGRVLWQYTDKTDATRITEGALTAYYQSTEHKAIRWRGGSSGPLLSFYDVATPIARQVLATGAGATVDNVISALQALGLVKQS